jgi:predicted AlkP superfamily pyrophosphatase or phosphodiesterase
MAATALLICVYTMLTPPALVVPEAEAVQLRRGLTSRLILIDVDALRRDFGSNPSVMPNVVALAKTGASGTAQVNGVSMSLPAIKAWTTGESFTARDIVADFWGIDPHSESVFYHAKKRGLKVYFSGPPEWVRSFEPSFAGYYTHRNAESNTEENDRLTQANALRFARAGFDVLAVHYINGVCWADIQARR